MIMRCRKCKCLSPIYLEHSARAADDHRRRDARNICGADTAGQRGADGLQRSERALVTGSTAALSEHFTGSVFQNISHFADLEELCADAVQQTDNAQKDQYGCAQRILLNPVKNSAIFVSPFLFPVLFCVSHSIASPGEASYLVS